MSDELYQAAERYTRLGLSVIPLQSRGKQPAIPSWMEYQDRPADASQRKEWFGNGKEWNVAIVCGRVSGDLVALDFDDPTAYEQFAASYPDLIERTRVHKTARGFHVLVRVPGSVKTFEFEGGDVKGEGSYVVAPPSIHPSGALYVAVSDVEQIATVASLDELGIRPRRNATQMAPTGGDPTVQPNWVNELLQGVPERQRNTAAIRLAGRDWAKPSCSFRTSARGEMLS